MKSGNYFFDREKFRTIDTLRVMYFIVFLLSFAITEIGRSFYRPYIYSNNIQDFGIADSIGNLGGIVVQIFFGLTILNPNREKGIRIIVFFVLGYILYEIIQPYLPKGVFDWKDIIGTIIGGMVGFLIFSTLHRSVKKNRIIYKF